jgi:transposase-like protein
MDLRQFERLKSEVATRVSAAQILELEDVVRRVVASHVAEIALTRRQAVTVVARQCPRCSSRQVVLHGKDKNGRQRFRCRGCKRTYNTLTGTPMARARKPHLWGEYLGHMTSHVSIRKIGRTGIDLNHVTIWRWRHRFLQAAAADNATSLSGVIEADETFFVQSFKGHRGWARGKPPTNRAARPSAWGALKRGISGEQVPVLTALDSAGRVFEAVLSSTGGVEAALAGRIAPGSVVCSDGAMAYVKAAVRTGAEHRRVIVPTVTPLATKALPLPTKRRKRGRLGLGRVNAHHERIKTLVNRRCRGVATRYLGSYLGWQRTMLRDGFAGTALLKRALG